MPSAKQSSELEISEDMEFQRRTWIVERVAWVVLGSIIVAAALGLFGKGVFGSSVAETADGNLSVEFDRFWRLQSPTNLRMELRPPVPSAEHMRVWIERGYLDSISVTRVTPEPRSVESGADSLVYEFALAEPAERARIVFRIEPERAGRAHARLGVEGGDEVAFSQFIYP